MNENINLCEILKDCPKGMKFFSYIHGEVEFLHIDPSVSHPIIVTARTNRGTTLDKTFSKKGRYDNDYNGICTLVPSLEQPDWSKWHCLYADEMPQGDIVTEQEEINDLSENNDENKG